MSGIKKLFRKALGKKSPRVPPERPPQYKKDGMALWDRNVEFLQKPRFRSAYNAGMASGHKINGGGDIGIEWRVHVACWAASHAVKLGGDFVECGVNTGMMSLAICHYLDFNATGKKFWLFDTYSGIPLEQAKKPEEIEHVLAHNKANYFECFELAKKNFLPYPNAILVRGMVPETLSSVKIDRVSYLSVDMNIPAPERAALEYFWPKMVSGGIVLFDDYGFSGYEEQHELADKFASTLGVSVLSLPTGQGILIKP
jgi:hypothetical protein